MRFIGTARIAIIHSALLAVVPLAHIAAAQSNPAPARPAAGSARATQSYGNLPLSFEPNLGQTSSEVQWLAHAPEYTLFLTGHDAVLEMNTVALPPRADGHPQIHGSALRMNLRGANALPAEAGRDRQSGKVNYFTGSDPSKWRRNVPTYSKVSLEGVYPGIDLVYYGYQGRLEYDFVVAPGADTAAIQLSFDGAKARVDAKGDLVLPIQGGPEVRFHKPVIYQVKNGVRQRVDGSFVVAANRQVSFHLGAYDRSRELVIDPTLVFLGALGTGNQQTVAYGMALDSNDEMILTGITNDLTFPVTTGALQSVCNEYSSYAGQTLDRCGANSGGSGFVTKISEDGKSLVYSTYLHGTDGWEYGDAVAVDTNGDAYIEGGTSSNDFPTTSNALQTICAPSYSNSTVVPSCDGYSGVGGTEYNVNAENLFIAELDPTGSNLLYSTFVGGSASVYPAGIALDSSNNIYFAGYVTNAWPEANLYPNTSQTQYPTTSTAFQQYGSGEGAASLSVLKIGADSSKLTYSTLYGTTDTKDANVGYNQPLALAVGSSGLAYIGGVTTSAALPTKGAIKPKCATADQPNDSVCYAATGWLAAFYTTDSASSSLAYATYVGGTELPQGLATQNEVTGLFASYSDLFVTGWTSNIDFPATAGTYQTACSHANEANTCDSSFLLKLETPGTMLWSTYYGGANGTSHTVGTSISLDSLRHWVYLYGYNSGSGSDLPLVNPLEAQNGSSFAFFAAFSADGTQLLYASPLFESCCSAYNVFTSNNGGICWDPATVTLYFTAYGNDGGAIVTTPHTYATPATSSSNRTFFAKLSPFYLDPQISWPTPAPITYGTAIGPTQENATANPGCNFAYDPVAGSYPNAGTQKITVTCTPYNRFEYEPVTATVALTVNPVVLTVTAENTSRGYGAANPTFQYTITGFVHGDGVSVVKGTPALSTAATPTSPLGNYPITPSLGSLSAANYTFQFVNGTLAVTQATPSIAWAAPAAITYGTPLSSTQLNASTPVPGTFSYSPAPGTIPSAGQQTLTVIFTPNDTTDYTTATAAVTLTVNPQTPRISWAAPAPITYAVALGNAQLDAHANVPGTLVYTPARGAILTAGTQTLSVTFTPTDTVDYTAATDSVSLTVNQRVPRLSWSTPAPITYGVGLGAAQLDASTGPAGTFAYTPAKGTILTAGSQTLSVTFTPTDTVDYTPASDSVTLTVEKRAPHITWPTPAPIVYGEAVGATQEDATSPVAGTFSYYPAVGWKPEAGTHTLTATFTPTDTADYKTTTASVTLTVDKADPVLTWATPAPITAGTAVGATQQDAKANVPGTFSYYPAAGWKPAAGTHPMTATFFPLDTVDYANGKTVSVTLTVNP